MLGTEIFWLTVLYTCVISIVANIIGRFLFSPFSFKLRVPAKFYLSSAAGIAFLVIYAMTLGKFFSFNNVWAYKVGICCILVIAIFLENSKTLLVKNSIFTALFSLGCGVCLLLPLFLWGAYNTHNDTVTYLVHGNWLQNHLFSETILENDVTPALTQMSMYQRAGFRMGASYLLGLLQGFVSAKDALLVLPAVLIVTVAACLRAVGFSLRIVLARYSYFYKSQILTLPAFTLGGVVFAMTFGFLPQIVGITVVVLIFGLTWPLLEFLTKASPSIKSRAYKLILFALFMAAAIASYSEMAPFLLLSLVVTILLFILRTGVWRSILIDGTVILALSCLFLNSEIFRILKALKIQSGVVVGSPIDWTLTGYLAHMIGLHGGAWDVFRWDLTKEYGVLFPVFLILGYLFFSIRRNPISLKTFLKTVKSNPAYIVFITILLLGIVYFRYFVKSPFAIGTGQSWSQFKLSDWAHPFVSFLILLFLSIYLASKKHSKGILLALFLVGIFLSSYASFVRMQPIVSYYGVGDIGKFYEDFRSAVSGTCGNSERTYLALAGTDSKFRQVAAVYLSHLNIASDWTGDDYIYSDLPSFRKSMSPKIGDCTVFPAKKNQNRSDRIVVGKFQIGFTDAEERLEIATVQGGFPRETDGANWWYWFESHIEFTLPQVEDDTVSKGVRIYFEYVALSSQNLKITAVLKDGRIFEKSVALENQEITYLSVDLDVKYSEITKLVFDSDGAVHDLSQDDHRRATTMIRNLRMDKIN